MSLIVSKDNGRAWLRGGWKKEPSADHIGKDIGWRDNDVAQEGEDKEPWFEKGRKGMDMVAEGLRVF